MTANGYMTILTKKCVISFKWAYKTCWTTDRHLKFQKKPMEITCLVHRIIECNHNPNWTYTTCSRLIESWCFLTSEQAKWLGGYKDKEGKPVNTLDSLKRILGPDFTLMDDRGLPMFIRETARKNQWTVPQLSVWRRKWGPESWLS